MTFPKNLLVRIVIGTVLAVRNPIAAQSDERLNQLWSALPEMLSAILAEEPYKTRYVVSDAVNPFYLEGNYDGDRSPDYLVMVTDRNTSTHRGLLFLSSRKEPFVLYDSAKIDHHPLDSWANCHWVDCGRTFFKGKSVRQGRPLAGADAVTFQFGGPNVIWFWDGKQMRRHATAGE